MRFLIAFVLLFSIISGSAPPASAQPPPAPAYGIWIGAAELAALPTSGAAWSALKSLADSAAGTPDISDQEDNTDQTVLAKALVYARTGETKYRAEVIAALKSAPETENGGRTLALARNLLPYVVAADLVNLPAVDPAYDAVFRKWLDAVRRETLDGRTLISTNEDRPNNWGLHAGASRIAAALYLGDENDVDRAAAVLRGWMGDRDAYAEFSYGELFWQCDQQNPVGVNPAGCKIDGVSVGGSQPEEMRRAGGKFTNPPAKTGYPWEALQGVAAQVLLLERAGYDAAEWEDRALFRAVEYLYGINWPAEGDDTWIPWIVNHLYGSAFPTVVPSRAGKNIGFTDWTHAARGVVMTPGPSATAAPSLTSTRTPTMAASTPTRSATSPGPTPTGSAASATPTPSLSGTIICTCQCTCGLTTPETNAEPDAEAADRMPALGTALTALVSAGVGAGGLYAYQKRRKK